LRRQLYLSQSTFGFNDLPGTNNAAEEERNFQHQNIVHPTAGILACKLQQQQQQQRRQQQQQQQQHTSAIKIIQT